MREDPRTKKALRTLIRHPTLALKALAEDLGIAYRTIASWVEADGPVPTLDQVRQLVVASARYDGAAARQLAEELFGLPGCGWFLAEVPRVAAASRHVVQEVLEVGAATGRVTGWAAAASPGGVSPMEAEEGVTIILDAERELAEARAAVGLFETPQLRIAGVPA